jgi:hypothetical protein
VRRHQPQPMRARPHRVTVTVRRGLIRPATICRRELFKPRPDVCIPAASRGGIADVTSMIDPHAAWNWATAHLLALFYVVAAHGREAVAWVRPWLRAVTSWFGDTLQGAIAWAGPTLRHAVGAAYSRLASMVEGAGVYWPAAAIAAVAVVAALAFAIWLRRRRRIKATLVEVRLDRDPKTDWLKLNIVMRNIQSHALLVRSLKIEWPANARICEHWKAWGPSAEGARFIAPDLPLTNVAEIGRTIRPHGAGGAYHRATALPSIGSDDDEFRRSFYLSPPAVAGQPVRLRAVLHCELQTRKGRPQTLSFQQVLQQSIAPLGAIPSSSQTPPTTWSAI